MGWLDLGDDVRELSMCSNLGWSDILGLVVRPRLLVRCESSIEPYGIRRSMDLLEKGCTRLRCEIRDMDMHCKGGRVRGVLVFDIGTYHSALRRTYRLGEP